MLCTGSQLRAANRVHWAMPNDESWFGQFNTKARPMTSAQAHGTMGEWLHPLCCPKDFFDSPVHQQISWQPSWTLRLTFVCHTLKNTEKNNQFFSSTDTTSVVCNVQCAMAQGRNIFHPMPCHCHPFSQSSRVVASCHPLWHHHCSPGRRCLHPLPLGL